MYIDLNIKFRIIVKLEFEKYFFKLMKYLVLEKIMENIRNRVNDIRQVGNSKMEVKFFLKVNCKYIIIFDENLIIDYMQKNYLYFDKLVYLYMIVFDLSKILMYDFYYNYMNMKYGEGVRLLFIDFDLLMYEIID